VAGSCEQSNEPWGSIRGTELLDHKINYQLLKDFALWNEGVALSTGQTRSSDSAFCTAPGSSIRKRREPAQTFH
jgi:hypothetical protein